jgi:hypothetical protein
MGSIAWWQRKHYRFVVGKHVVRHQVVTGDWMDLITISESRSS